MKGLSLTIKVDTLSGNYEILYTKYVKPLIIKASRILLVGAYMVSNGVYLKIHQNGTAVEKTRLISSTNQRSKAEMYQQRLKSFN
jgi:hypothetical protein